MEKHDPMEMYRGAKEKKIVQDKQRKHDEDTLSVSISRAIRNEHNCLVHIDKSEGYRSHAAGNQFQAGSDNKWPDVFAAMPSKIYHGLFLEVKDKAKLFNKNGTWQRGSNDHHVLQHKRHLELIAAGYYACFVWDKSQALMIASKYANDERLYPDVCIWNSLTFEQRDEIAADEFEREFFNP